MAGAPDPSSVRVEGPWTHRDVYANGIRVHVAEAGSGPLVLLLHGFAEFWWAWRHQLPALAGAGYRAVAVDLRGYGDTDKPPRGYDAWTLAGDVAGLVRALGEDTAHVVGHGWGGQLAWSVGALHPRLVRSITTVSAPHPLALRGRIRRTALRGRSRNQALALGHVFRAQLPVLPERWLTRERGAVVETLIRRWAGERWQTTPDFVECVSRCREAALVQGVAHCSMEYYRWAVRSLLRSEGRRFTEALSRPVDVPAQQLYGAGDPCILPGSREASKDHVAHHVRHDIPETGHFPHEEDPGTTNALLLRFLAAH
ncbi:alpha/beta fold hydrolase [Actinokineospora bangkokensis]|uniref:Alpha/beta hydrolase n=1 Tax=Actinokineospora bangkokensis TaxID=1193682 RepID=A0A1Q9LCE7_9PSEU|nr:alpha/beta hydrolase [Actinokineospora bangkokensis]OLR89707.1 alpha/beta hydrolase [Actinokineospora bangkokensis]